MKSFLISASLAALLAFPLAAYATNSGNMHMKGHAHSGPHESAEHNEHHGGHWHGVWFGPAWVGFADRCDWLWRHQRWRYDDHCNVRSVAGNRENGRWLNTTDAIRTVVRCVNRLGPPEAPPQQVATAPGPGFMLVRIPFSQPIML